MEISEDDQLEEMRVEILNNFTDGSMDEIFKIKLKRAKQIYLSLVYPYNREITELPNNRAKEWQTACAIELYNMHGDENVIQYSENGLSETRAKAGLSQDLLNLLPPAKAGVPK